MSIRISAPVFVVALASLAACSSPSSEPQGSASSPSTINETDREGAPGAAGEIGTDQGADDSSIEAASYFKALQTPIAWSADQVDAAMALLPASCSADAVPEADSANVAMVVDGACKETSRTEAHDAIDKLGQMYALQGIDLVEALSDKATSATETDERVAEPQVDLGNLVDQQLANLDTGTGGGDIGTASLRPLAEPAAEDDWVGGGKTISVGSDQFSGSATGFFHVFRRNGVGVYAAADVTGKAFGVQRQLLYANLETKGLTGQRGQAKAVVRAFGSDLFNRSFDEPQTTGDYNLASVNTNHDGTIHFSVGPVPFSVTWSFHLQGSIPITYALRPTAAEATLHPTLAATIGLQGGADVVIAQAGVGGEFTIVDTDFSARADASIQTKDNAPSVCSNATADFNLRNMMGGRLFAYAQVGRPDVKVFRVPLGWRGELEFVHWEGATRTFNIVSLKDQCYAAL